MRHRVDGAQHIRGVRQCQHFHVGRHRRMQCRQIQCAIGQQFSHLEHSAGALGDQLPRHDIGVVLHARDQDAVTGLQARQCPGIRHQIDGKGGAAAQDQLVAADIEKARQLAACAFVRLGGLTAQRVHRTADIGIVMAIKIVGGVDHARRFLPGIGRIEIDQRLAVYLPGEQGEVGTHRGPVDSGGIHTHAPTRANARSSAVAHTACVLLSAIPLTTSRQNAPVNNALACASGRPRERR